MATSHRNRRRWQLLPSWAHQEAQGERVPAQTPFLRPELRDVNQAEVILLDRVYLAGVRSVAGDRNKWSNTPTVHKRSSAVTPESAVPQEN